MGTARVTEAERLDALRRRLYAPDVTEEDLVAYRAAAERVRTDVADEAAHAPPAPPRPRRRTTAVVGGVALLVGAVIVLLVTAHPLAALVAPAPKEAPSASAGPRIVDAELTTSASARADFVLALQRGDQAGLLDYLFTHSAYIPAAISTPRRAASTEYSGQGTGTIRLDPSDLTQHGGRVTVFLVVDRPATYSWHAQRVVSSTPRLAVLEVAEQAGTVRAGEPTTATFRYSGRAPTRLALYTDETVKWGVVVVFTD